MAEQTSNTLKYLQPTQWAPWWTQLNALGLGAGSLLDAKSFRQLAENGAFDTETITNPFAHVPSTVSAPNEADMLADASKKAFLSSALFNSDKLKGVTSQFADNPYVSMGVGDFYDQGVNQWNTEAKSMQGEVSGLMDLYEGDAEDARRLLTSNAKTFNEAAKNEERMAQLFGPNWKNLIDSNNKKGLATDKSLEGYTAGDYQGILTPDASYEKFRDAVPMLQTYGQRYGGDVVGEQGPEMFTNTTNNPLQIVSSTMAPGSTVPETGSVLGQESNAVGSTVAEQEKNKYNKKMAAGGTLEPGETALVGEQGPETALTAGSVNGGSVYATSGRSAGSVDAGPVYTTSGYTAPTTTTGSTVPIVNQGAAPVVTTPPPPPPAQTTYAPAQPQSLPQLPDNPLQTQTQNAVSQQLSGAPSSTINEDTTQQFIQKSIADPARRDFQLETVPTIKSAGAGPGYWGSAVFNATNRAKGDLESNISSQGAQYAYMDEQARRDLAENAANRQAGAIPMSLNVQNNPLLQQQTQANIAGTQAATNRINSMTPYELSQMQASTGGIQAQTAGTQAQTAAQLQQTQQSGQLFGGTLQQQQAQTQAMWNTNRQSAVQAMIAEKTWPDAVKASALQLGMLQTTDQQSYVDLISSMGDIMEFMGGSDAVAGGIEGIKAWMAAVLGTGAESVPA